MQSGCTLNFDKEKLIDDIANMLINKLGETLDKRDKIVFGQAKDSLEYDKKLKLVGSKLEYMPNIEYGRTSGYHVPIQPLREWIYVRFKIYGKEADEFAHAIERKIFERGIPLTRFAKVTLSELQRL